MTEEKGHIAKKIGVYICQCGSNISDYVDVGNVCEVISQDEEVSLAKVIMFACADASQKEMIADIQNESLDAIVVASCSPKLHLNTFRSVTERGGLNGYHYVQVNIREQDSWAHSDRPDEATDKAISLIRAGVARAGLSEALSPVSIPACKDVAIIGAGAAGMRAAIELARLGVNVHLIEKEHFVGGRTAQWDDMSMTDQSGTEIITGLYNQIIRYNNITLHTGAAVVASKGSIGNYLVKVKIEPRHVGRPYDTEAIKKAIEACPVEIEDAFDFGLTRHKALYINHPGQLPSWPAIDMKACTHCGECLKHCNNIDLDEENTVIDINVGAILLTTGFDPYKPIKGEFGYQEIREVVTLQQLKRLLTLNQDELWFRSKQIKRVAFIYCVGSRQEEGGKEYCSRYCCTSAIHTAIQLREKFGVPYIYHLHRGIRTYGKQEILYENSSRAGDRYLRFLDDDPPVVEQNNNEIRITINDFMTNSRAITMKVDLIVLVTGMVPRLNKELVDILKIPLGKDGFYNEIHPKLRPVETVIDGLVIAGCCQAPKNLPESVSSSLAAVAKIYSLISKGFVQIEPTQAVVNSEICTWCGKCSDACPIDAIEKVETEKGPVARVLESNCKGCGMCTPVCPEEAIDIKSYSNAEIRSMIEALAE